MQYFRNSQNNRLASPFSDKEAQFAAELDTASDSSFQKPVSQLKTKRSPNLPSPLTSHITSIGYNSIDERNLFKQEQQLEPCILFFGCGYCPQGLRCCYGHCIKTIQDIKKGSKLKLNNNIFVYFPQLLGVGMSRRIPSFLQ